MGPRNRSDSGHVPGVGPAWYESRCGHWVPEGGGGHTAEPGCKSVLPGVGVRSHYDLCHTVCIS